jgi:hypothetical protein
LLIITLKTGALFALFAMEAPDGWQEVPDGWQEVPDGWQEIPDGWQEIPDGWQLFLIFMLAFG